MKNSWIFLLLAVSAAASDTTLLFRTHSYDVGPFPSDSLTVSDSTQKTGLRVNLPTPSGCAPGSPLGYCANNAMINQLDGFNPNARLTLCFSAAIQPTTVTSAVFLTPVSGTQTTTTVNQVIFDPKSNCAYAKPEVVLDQHTQYLLTVTNALIDAGGKPVKADPAFVACASQGSDPYCVALGNALPNKYQKTIIGASVFTTLSASDFLEKARAKINSFSTPELVTPAGYPFVFPLGNIASMTWNIDSGPIPSQIIPTSLPGVDSVAFGLFLSPKYLVGPSGQPGTIPYTPTNQQISPDSYVAVSFHVYLPPASKMAQGGFPVAIYGHGLGDSQFGAPTNMASTLAKAGIATVAIEITGHGFGPKSTVQIVDNQGFKTTILTPGRGVPLNGSPVIGPTDGCIVIGAPIATRDCARQTAVDLFAFTRTLTDFQGFGLGLNPGRIYFVGQSLGSIYGTMLHALEPRVRAAVINGGGGSQADIARLALAARPLGDAFLQYTNPGLFNVLLPPPNNAPPEQYFNDAFNDNYPYRNYPTHGKILINDVPGAILVQAAFEEAEWIVMSGDALAYGPLLQGKPTAFQFGIGDLEVPNPTESALVRAARGQASTWLLNFPIAASIDPTLAALTSPQSGPLPILPHRILSNPTIVDVPNENLIAQAEQQQAATFFSSDGRSLANPNGYLQGIFTGVPLFFQPSSLSPLPDCLNYFQLGPQNACSDTGR